MPPVDLVPACAGGSNDRKIACETLADGGAEEESIKGEFIADEDDADMPPESFLLSKDAEYDWFDRNAFYERRDSGKGNTNSTNLNAHNNPNSNHNSQRFSVSLKSRASIIGLPKMQKNNFVDSNRRTCKSVNIRLFPKRSSSAGKSTVAVTDPGSPNVSCMGRVRSKRGRRKSNSVKRGDKKPAVDIKSGGEKKKKSGLYSKVMSMFRTKKSNKKGERAGSRKVVEMREEKPAEEPERKSVSVKPVSDPPSLGGMKRFASGRHSGAWTAEDFNQVERESVDIDRRVGIMGRS